MNRVILVVVLGIFALFALSRLDDTPSREGILEEEIFP